jgi:hypothetical protein
LVRQARTCQTDHGEDHSEPRAGVHASILSWSARKGCWSGLNWLFLLEGSRVSSLSMMA